MIIHSPIFSGSINQAESAYANLSGSFTGSFKGIGDFEGLEADSVAYENVTGKPTLVSGSSQVAYPSLSNIPSGIVSGSSQVVGILTSLNTYTASNDTTNTTQNSRLTSIESATGSYETKGRGIVSGSSQITYSEISSIPSGIVSGSSQVTPLLPTGTVSGSSQVSYPSLSNIPAGIVSGSSQVVLNDADKTGFDTTDVVEGTNLYYTDARVKTKLDTDTVVSGSSQILTLVSIDEDEMTSNSDTKLPTQQSVKSYVDSKVAGLVDSAPGALDTLNELAAALGDDANFSTTISNQIAGKVSQSLEIISGDGLTGGGNLTTNRTLAVGAGDGITVTADAVAVNNTVLRTTGFGIFSGSIQVDHDATTNFVANEHIDHSNVTITAGDGLTGGGTIAATRTLNVVGTAGRITVSADAVDIASTYVGQSTITTLGTISAGTWNGSVIASAYLDADTAHLTTTQTFSGAKTFSAVTTISNSTASTTTGTGALLVTGGVGIGGALNVGGDVVAFASSDKRLKDNIKNIENPIQKVQKLNGVTWDWNSNADELQQSLPNVGVIAQEVEEVLPQLVHDRDNGYKGVDYAKLTGLLIEAIKEQQKQIDELKSKLQ
jgi:hypothetical protein